MAGWVGVNDADFLGVLERQPTIYKRKVPVWWVCYIEIQLGESILTPTHPITRYLHTQFCLHIDAPPSTAAGQILFMNPILQIVGWVGYRRA
jgi:hypothetical protein